MLSGIDKRTKEIVDAMNRLNYKAGTRISMNERTALANEVRKNPKKRSIIFWRSSIHKEN
jgi:hypothetical protein